MSTVRLTAAVAIVSLGLAVSAHAQSPYRLRDINPGPQSSRPEGPCLTDNVALFWATDTDHGMEPWVTDGTRAGTRLLVDLAPGPASSSRGTCAAVGGWLFFTVIPGAGGAQLWKSDGTPEQTMLVKDWPAGTGAAPSQLVSSGGSLFFRASTAAEGAELWKSDGTSAGTVMIRDIAPGSTSSSPQGLKPFAGGVAFSATTPAEGSELWTSDGTATGTVLVIDLNGGSGGSFPAEFTDLGGELVYVADGPSVGTELWITNGTAAGTRLVADINPGFPSSSPFNLFGHLGVIYFLARDPTFGRELHRTDGTTAGTWRVADLFPGSGSPSVGSPFKVAGDLLYFVTGIGPAASDYEVIRTDGTTAGTFPVADVYPGTQGLIPVTLGALEGRLYFAASSPGIWRTDGTSAGTVAVGRINPVGFASPNSPFVLAERLIFSADDGTAGTELWALDAGGPDVHAGPDQTVDVGQAVELSGSAVDPQGDELTFEWRGEDDELLGTGPSLSITFPVAGRRVLTLSATDGVHRGSDRVVIQVGHRLTVQVAVAPGEIGDGSVSIDAGGTCASGVPNFTPTCAFYFPFGTVLTLMATPAPGSALAGWAQDCTGTSACQVTMDGTRAVRATFGAAQWHLFVNSFPPPGASGAVRVEPPGTLCLTGTFCDVSVPRASPITLTALPSPGTAFESWNTPACGPALTCTFTPTLSNTFLNPTFRVPATLQIDLVGTNGGLGSVLANPPGSVCALTAPGTSQCNETYATAAVVTLTATAGEGSVFAGWQGPACAGSGIGPCVVTMSQSRTVQATFFKPTSLTLALTSVTDGAGSVSFAPASEVCTVVSGGTNTCVRTFAPGQSVTLTPTPAPGSTFTGWTGACSGTGGCNVVMSANTNVGATITGRRTLTVSLTGTAGGVGTVTPIPAASACILTAPATGFVCSYSHAHGQTVTLLANPGPDSVFDGWTGACSGFGSCEVSMTADRTVGAAFRGTRTMTVSLVGVDGGEGLVALNPHGQACVLTAPANSATCSNPYPAGTVVRLTPIATAGSFFQGWSGGGCSGTGTCDVTLSDHALVTAAFGHVNVPPSVAITSPTSGTVVSAPPVSVFVTASASDPDGTVARVEFFAGAVKIGESVAPPYGVTWSPSASGPYVLTARVTDDDGAAVDSAGVPVTVATNLPPTLAVTSPAPDASFVAPATVTLAATASDPDGSVVRVEFFEGGVSRGFDTTSPYSVVWSNVPAGAHALIAVATDNRGTTTSVPFTVNVAVRVALQADAYVRDGDPRENFGRETTLQVRKASGSNNTRWTYLRFSVSTVPSVSRVRLRLFGGLTDDGPPAVNAAAFPVASTTWNENSIAWNNKPATGATAIGSAPLDISTTAQRWYEWDLTAYVQAQKAAGRNVISIAIKNDVNTSARASFRSREASSNRPEILVTP